MAADLLISLEIARKLKKSVSNFYLFLNKLKINEQFLFILK